MNARSPFLDDPDLRPIAACLRPIAAPGRLAAITEALAAADPDRVVNLAMRHRVAGFVERGLADAGVTLPPAAADRLAREAGAARLQTLRNAAEEARLAAAFAAAGVDALFVKGATLGMRLYGTVGLKTSWDVDVLVARARIGEAGRVLEELGFRLHILDGVDDPVRIARYLAAHKESEWRHPGRGVTVELHTELSDNRAAIPTIGLGSPRDTVTLMPGAEPATLATTPLFAYLAYHGTTHLWARLKWIADVAALLHGEDVEALHAEAVALGAGRTPGVAILLAHELLGLDVPAALLATLRRDAGTRRLLRYSHAAIAAAEDDKGVLMRPLGELVSYVRAQAWLVPGMRHRWGAARRFLTRPYLPEHLGVPSWALPAAMLAALPLRLLGRPARLRRERQAGGNTASRP